MLGCFFRPYMTARVNTVGGGWGICVEARSFWGESRNDAYAEYVLLPARRRLCPQPLHLVFVIFTKSA